MWIFLGFSDDIFPPEKSFISVIMPLILSGDIFVRLKILENS